MSKNHDRAVDALNRPTTTTKQTVLAFIIAAGTILGAAYVVKTAIVDNPMQKTTQPQP